MILVSFKLCLIIILLHFLDTGAAQCNSEASACDPFPKVCMRGQSQCLVRLATVGVDCDEAAYTSEAGKEYCEGHCKCCGSGILQGFVCEQPPLPPPPPPPPEAAPPPPRPLPPPTPRPTPLPDSCLGQRVDCGHETLGEEMCECNNGVCTDADVQCSKESNFCYKCPLGLHRCACDGARCVDGLECVSGLCVELLDASVGVAGKPCRTDVALVHRCNHNLTCVRGQCFPCPSDNGGVGCACDLVQSFCAYNISCNLPAGVCEPCDFDCDCTDIAADYSGDACRNQNCQGCRLLSSSCQYCNRFEDDICVTNTRDCPNGIEPHIQRVCETYECTNNCGGVAAGQCIGPNQCLCLSDYAWSVTEGCVRADDSDGGNAGALVAAAVGGALCCVLSIVFFFIVYKRLTKRTIVGIDLGKELCYGSDDYASSVGDGGGARLSRRSLRHGRSSRRLNRYASSKGLDVLNAADGDGTRDAWPLTESGCNYRCISRDTAEAELRGQPTGTFIVRPSTQHNSKTLSYVDGNQNDAVRHILLVKQGSGWRKDNGRTVHNSVKALLWSMRVALGLRFDAEENAP